MKECLELMQDKIFSILAISQSIMNELSASDGRAGEKRKETQIL